MKNLLLLFVSCSVLLAGAATVPDRQEIEVETPEVVTVQEVKTDIWVEEFLPEPERPVKREIEEIQENDISEKDIELIALVTMAEAEGEPEEGKRLVIDTILNRVDSEHFPDTVYDVIYQPNQFTSMWNGRTDRCEVREDFVALVKDELESRYNSECVFFRTSHYSKYGVPMFQIGNHYFSSYN